MKVQAEDANQCVYISAVLYEGSTGKYWVPGAVVRFSGKRDPSTFNVFDLNGLCKSGRLLKVYPPHEVES